MNTDNANTYEISSFMLISNSSNMGSFFPQEKDTFFYSWSVTALDSNHILFPPSEPECFLSLLSLEIENSTKTDFNILL